MSFRLAKKIDYIKLKELWAVSFDEDPKFLEKFFSERTSIDKITVNTVDNQIVSALHMLPYNIELGAGTVKASYIVGAATFQQFRNKGYMEGLLEYSLKIMKKRGVALCVLNPVNHNFYKKYGWETSAKLYKYNLFKNKKLSYKPQIKLLHTDNDMLFKLWDFNISDIKLVELKGGYGYEEKEAFYTCIPLQNAEYDEVVDYTMLRIIDIQALSGKMPYNPQLPSIIKIVDSYAPWNEGLYSISNKNGLCLIEKTDGQASQHFTIQELTKLLFYDKSEIYEEF